MRRRQIYRYAALKHECDKARTVDPEFSKEGVDYPLAEEMDDRKCVHFSDYPKNTPETDPEIRAMKKRIADATFHRHRLREELSNFHRRLDTVYPPDKVAMG